MMIQRNDLIPQIGELYKKYLRIIKIFLLAYLRNTLVGLDQFVNSIFLGDPDETISSRSGRVWPNSWWVKFINFLIFWQPNHCYSAIEKQEGKRDLLFPRKDI